MRKFFDPDKDLNGYESSYDYNPYSNPEKCGLEIVAGPLDFSSGSYEFDYLIVWRDLATNKFYWGQDSGCSCPSPFEDARGLSDLTELPFDPNASSGFHYSRYAQAEDELRGAIGSKIVADEFREYVTLADAREFVSKVASAMRKVYDDRAAAEKAQVTHELTKLEAKRGTPAVVFVTDRAL